MVKRRRPVLLFAILLTLSAMLLVLAFGVVAGDDDDTECEGWEEYVCEEIQCLMSWVAAFEQASKEVSATMQITYDQASQSYATNQQAQVSVRAVASTLRSSVTDTVSLSLTLPPSVSGVSFVGEPPTSQQGNTYIWARVPISHDVGQGTMTTYSRTVSFYVGTEQGPKQLIAGLSYPRTGGGLAKGVWGSTYYVVQQMSADGADEANQKPGQAMSSDDAEQDIVLVELWNTPDKRLTLNEQTWQAALDSVGDATPFIGIAYPMSEDPSANSFRLPVMGGDHAPVFDIVSYDSGQQVVYSQTLVYSNEYVGTLVDAYPDQTAPFTVIGLPPGADLSPPPGIDLAPEMWELRLRVWLDLGASEAEMLDQVVWLYGGFEGTGMAASSLGNALTRMVHGAGLGWAPNQARLYQGEGVTILGPVSLRLRPAYMSTGMPNPPVQIRHSTNTSVVPGQRISVVHHVSNLTWTDTIEVDLDVETAQGSRVELCAGDYSGPTLPLEPVPDTLSLDGGQSTYVWLVGQVSGVRGLESWRLIGSVEGYDGTDERTDLFWVGDWTPPQGGDELWGVLLPMVIRGG